MMDRIDLKQKLQHLQNFPANDDSGVKYMLNEKFIIDFVDLLSLIPKE